MSEEQRPWPEPVWRIEAEQAEKQARAELRDRFAMAALTGLVSDPACGEVCVGAVCDAAYEYADAMLKARGDE